MLQSEFIPVAIDQAAQRRQRDNEGEFYRKIAGQAHDDFQGTTQGFYIATASGEMLLYNNNRDPAKVRRLMVKRLAEFARDRNDTPTVAAIETGEVDRRYVTRVPNGGLIVRVRAKVLGGYDQTDNRWLEIFQSAVSRDNLWLTAEENRSLVAGTVPDSLAERIARFHLVDNTRGEPPMWREAEVRSIKLTLNDGVLTGQANLQTDDGSRGFEAALQGYVGIEGGKVVRFDLVAKGDFWGEGPYTKRAPEGRFPLLITFELADGTDQADGLPPQGSRGWLDGYLR